MVDEETKQEIFDAIVQEEYSYKELKTLIYKLQALCDDKFVEEFKERVKEKKL